jgi:HNH endonuclease
MVSSPRATYRNGHQPGRDPREFWARTKKIGRCREWQGGMNDRGYGVLKWENQEWFAHRLAWTLTFGPIPDGMWVLHHCDNPPCVNAPGGCLYLGDHDQNVADKVRRGRQVDGERHGRAKLTAVQVEEIRRRYVFPSYEGAHDSNARALAEEFGVDRKQVQRLARGLAWRRP